ncbi:UNKNOWN [Stylonychia lemnae]|uniref:Transmembrane protein n=1 Tax=Stylonychia lemnae TaxID=5949 RepID=A0A078BCD8_STYLE|nr:UNKNOWN [Stylonychia lemnae]|eukprot:CDW90877.1 UNKNOWN [Stylonychia lemnae]
MNQSFRQQVINLATSNSGDDDVNSCNSNYKIPLYLFLVLYSFTAFALIIMFIFHCREKQQQDESRDDDQSTNENKAYKMLFQHLKDQNQKQGRRSSLVSKHRTDHYAKITSTYENNQNQSEYNNSLDQSAITINNRNSQKGNSNISTPHGIDVMDFNDDIGKTSGGSKLQKQSNTRNRLFSLKSLQSRESAFQGK